MTAPTPRAVTSVQIYQDQRIFCILFIYIVIIGYISLSLYRLLSQRARRALITPRVECISFVWWLARTRAHSLYVTPTQRKSTRETRNARRIRGTPKYCPLKTTIIGRFLGTFKCVQHPKTDLNSLFFNFHISFTRIGFFSWLHFSNYKLITWTLAICINLSAKNISNKNL